MTPFTKKLPFNLAGNLTAMMMVTLLIFAGFGHGASAESLAFKQAVAQGAGKDEAILEFYKARDYEPIWTSNNDRERRRTFLHAVSKAANHGLPVGRYDGEQLKRDFGSIKSDKARGFLEVETTKRFVAYSNDLRAGALEPSRVDKDMTIETPRRDAQEMLNEFVNSSPDQFFAALIPTHPDYARLMKEKVRLERIIANGGWGPDLSTRKLKPGSKGDRVVALRKRLTAMGFHRLGVSPEYNDSLTAAIEQFQADHGLNVDGVAGKGTVTAINVSAANRLKQVIVGLERQRWLNKPRGKRHIFVNQADFRAHVMDNGKQTLSTRVVVGKAYKFRTPEFSDEMTHLIINPTWYVPKSIARNEYLPQLQKDPTALRRQGLRMTDVHGRRVDSASLDYSQFDATNFPFDIKQPPSRRNALGRVKFMFPNRHNVYLHDTPSRSLFAREVRAFSHGCVRVHKPLELAYEILGRQSDQPEDLFHGLLDRGTEAQVDLDSSIPIHLTYHTVWITAQGRPNYRADVYGRDKKVFSALIKAGVVLEAVQG